MSTQPTNPQARDEAIDDLEVPAAEADAVTGGITFNRPPFEPTSETQGQITSI